MMANEDKEFEELALLEEFEAEEARLGNVDTSVPEAVFRGAAQAVTLNFADEIEAGLDTAASFLGEKEFTSVEDMSNDYNKNLEIARAEFSKNAIDHPTATNVGTGVGVVASLALPGGAIVKGATLGAKALSAAKIGSAYGAFAGLGSAEDKMSLKGAMKAAEGAAVGAVGGAVISGAIGGVGKLLSKIPSGESKRLINSAFKGIGLNTVASRKKFASDLNRKGVNPMKWIKRISKETDVDGKPLINNITESYTSIHTKVGNKITQYAETRDGLLLKVKTQLSREDVAKQIKSALVGSKGSTTKDADFLNSLVDDMVVLKKGIIKTKDQGEVLGKVIDESPLSAIELDGIRKALDANIKFDSVTSANAVKKDLRAIFNDMSDNLVGKFGDDAAKADVKGLRSKMSDLYSLQNSLEKGIEHEQFGENAIVKDLMAGARAKMMTSWMGKGVSDAAQITGIALRQMAVSPRINRSMSFNAIRIADSLPNVAEASLRRLMLTAEQGDMMQFNQDLASIVAESDIRQEPISRNASRAIDRQDSILALAQSVDADLAANLREAFINKDEGTIGAILSEMAKDPEAKGLFEPGVGFDGRVYSDEDKAQLELQLKTSDIPAAQRIQMLGDLRSNGTIPDLNQVVTPEPQFHVPRTKKIHDF